MKTNHENVPLGAPNLGILMSLRLDVFIIFDHLKEEFPAVSHLDADFSKSDSGIHVFALTT